MKRRHPTKKPWIVAGIVAVPVLIVAAILLQPWWRAHKTQNDVNELVIALQAYAIEFGKMPAGSTAEICAALRGKNPRREAVVEGYVVNAAGEFLDPYGTPYRLNTETIRVHSCGPNKQDEGGAGDDIASWR